MKIRQQTLDLINNPVTRTKIALSLKQGEQSVAIMCRRNIENGPLTKAAAIKVIKEETGLEESEILTEEIEKDGTHVKTAENKTTTGIRIKKYPKAGTHAFNKK